MAALSAGVTAFISVIGTALIISFIMNSIIIYLIVADKKLLNATNLMIANLAISDIFMSAFVLPQNLHDMTHVAEFYEGKNKGKTLWKYHFTKHLTDCFICCLYVFVLLVLGDCFLFRDCSAPEVLYIKAQLTASRHWYPRVMIRCRAKFGWEEKQFSSSLNCDGKIATKQLLPVLAYWLGKTR